ncbi:MAG: Asp-tRNA(Asn)/Glu-tRNA(Gln) amidotransferase subunit GatA [Bdellovibrionia bacterium]
MSPGNLTEKFGTIRQIHDAFDKKLLSPVELTRDYLAAAKASQTGAYLLLCEERAMEQAKGADKVLAREGKVPRDRMPLLGIPLGIKDNLTMDGVRTTCGSKMLENYIPPYTATCVDRLEKAGAISLGKLNMDEFAMGGSNENSAFGPVKHPTHPDRVPGGSSGGSAAAVGAGLCVASLGSDTGGSIRLPASYCGVIGVKPTYGRISRYGLIAFASSLDQVGPLAHTVEDAALLTDVMSGFDPMDSTTASMPASRSFQALQKPADLNQLRVGIPKEFFIGGLAPDVEKAIQASLRWLESQGAKLVPISLPHTQYAVAIYYIVAVSEASANLARFDGVRFGVRPKDIAEAKDLTGFYEAVRSGFGAEVKRRIILGTFALSSGYTDAYYKRACQVRRQTKQDFDAAFQDVDLIVGPVAPTTAFKLGEKTKDPLQMYLNDIFTIPANLVGLPSMSVPCGHDAQGLPIGFHIMAPLFQEDRMFSVAQALFNGLGKGSTAGRL